MRKILHTTADKKPAQSAINIHLGGADRMSQEDLGMSQVGNALLFEAGPNEITKIHKQIGL